MRKANKVTKDLAKVLESENRRFSIKERDRADKNGFILELGELHRVEDENGFCWVCPESYGNRTQLEEVLYDTWKSVVEKEVEAEGIEKEKLHWNLSHNFRSGYGHREGWGCFTW
jgi:hypothetical protein